MSLTPQQKLQLAAELTKPEYANLSNELAASAAFGKIRQVLDIKAKVTPFLIVSGMGAKLDIARVRGNLSDEALGAIAEAQMTYLTQPFLDMSLERFQGGLVILRDSGVWSAQECALFDQLSYVAISPEDVQAVRNAAAIEATQTLEEALGTAHGTALAMVQQSKAALEAGTSTTVPTKEQIIAAFTGAFE